MKKIYKSILFTLLAGMAVTSCDSYEAPEITSDPAVTIVSRETTFPAAASTGTIKFKADGPVTVTTENQWITATVEGDEIKVSCSQNNSLQGRTGVITAKCGGNSSMISIIQDGILFQLGENMDDGLTFAAGKATKVIEIKANAPIQVTSDSEWLSADVSEGVLTISVDDNISLDERNGSLKITYGDNESELGVKQDGIWYPIFDRTEWYTTDAKTRYNLDYPFDQDIEYSCSDPEMLTYEWDKEKGKLYINVEKNETGHLRTGSFSYTIGPKSGNMWVHQCDFYKDIAAEDYALYFTDPKDGQLYYLPAVIKKQGWDYLIEIPAYGIAIPFAYDNNDHTMTITGGQNCGLWNNKYYIFTTFGFVEDGTNYYTWSTDPSIKALPDYGFSTESNVGFTSIEFEDAGTFEAPLTYFQLYAFTSDTPSSSTGAGYLERMVNPFLMRIHQVADETPSAAPAKAPKATKANPIDVRSAKLATPSKLIKADDVRAY